MKKPKPAEAVLSDPEEIKAALSEHPEQITVDHRAGFLTLCEWQERYKRYRITAFEVLPGACRVDLSWYQPKQGNLL